MKKVEVFFDYLCPYCYEGHKNLRKLMPKRPDIEFVWVPCEAHPRPEVSKIYSDIAMRAMYFVRDNAGDLEQFHDLVYEANFEDKLPIDDAEVLAQLAGRCGVDSAALKKALADGMYAEDVHTANRYAWGDMGWEAVPSYACDGKKIGSRGGVLVPLEKLDEFLSSL